MRHLAFGIWLAALFPLACGGGGSKGPGMSVDPTDETGGTSGTPTGGSATGGAPATGGATGTGGAVTADAAVAGTGGDMREPDGGPAVGGAGGGAGMLAVYEAEAVMPNGPNELIKPAVISNCPNMSPTCGPLDTVKPETPCCSQGKEVRQLLRGNGGLIFNKVAAPADGMYDVTWFYHCGKNDNFGDGNCGGEPNHPAGGCRPHVLTVNGTRLPKVYEFHCYPGMWGEIHLVTTPLPLKSGDNSIRVTATPGRDAADLDAIAVFPAGKGLGPAAFAH